MKLKNFTQKLSPKKRRLLLLLLLVILAALLVATVWKKPESLPAESGVITHSTDQPDESKQAASEYQWRGEPDEPKKIRIPKIGIDSFVQQAGVDQNNQIAVPNNVHLAGWFVDSQKPGQNGLSIISGHVSGRTTDGVFKELASLAPGDKFEVELGSGQVLQYTVVGLASAKTEDSASLLFSQKPNIKSQLNLITCDGPFDRAANQYTERLILYSELNQ
jgi:LPXTG-site transpeptidase (sortase) family protein